MGGCDSRLSHKGIGETHVSGWACVFSLSSISYCHSWGQDAGQEDCCASVVEHFLCFLIHVCPFQIPHIFSNTLAPPLWGPFQEPCDGQWEKTEKDYMGHLYWRASCLVLNWTSSLPSGPVALPAPAQRQTLQAWIHVACASQSTCTMKRCSDGARPAGRVTQQELAGAIQPMRQGRTNSLYDFSWLNCFDYTAKSWPKQRVKLLKKKKVRDDKTKQRREKSTGLKCLRCLPHKFRISFLWSPNQVCCNAICRYRLLSFSLLLSNDAFVVQLQSPLCPGKWIMHPGASTTWVILLILKIKKK